MRILESGKNFKVSVSEDGDELEIERHPRVKRRDMKKTTNAMMKGVWVAHGLEEREDGTLYERWIKHT